MLLNPRQHSVAGLRCEIQPLAKGPYGTSALGHAGNMPPQQSTSFGLLRESHPHQQPLLLLQLLKLLLGEKDLRTVGNGHSCPIGRNFFRLLC